MLFRLFAISVFFCGPIAAQSLLPPHRDPALAGDRVLRRLVNTSASRVKGAHCLNSGDWVESMTAVVEHLDRFF